MCSKSMVSSSTSTTFSNYNHYRSNHNIYN